MTDSLANTSRWLGRRYLFQVGTVRVPSYSVMLYFGSVVGIFAGAMMQSTGSMDPQHFALAAIVLLIPALVGARLWFVLQNWKLFRTDPNRILRPDSGAARDGGLILSVVASVPVLAIGDLPFWSFWDAATITLLVGTIITRIGCLMNGCCAGRTTSGPFGVWLPNHSGEWRRRFPTPLLEAGLSVFLLIGIVATGSDSHTSGTVFASAVVGYAVGRPLIALTRETGDFQHRMRISLAVSLVFFVTALAVLLIR